MAALLATRLQRTGGLPLRVLDAIETGELVLVFSVNMAERLAARLEDVVGIAPIDARTVANAYVALADPPGLLTRESPVIALGHGPHAEEDARVLEAALAGEAQYLVTYNLDDFLPAASPHPTMGYPSVLGVQIVAPHELARALGWPLRAPPPTTTPAPPEPGGT